MIDLIRKKMTITIIKIVFSKRKSTTFEKVKLEILERTNMQKGQLSHNITVNLFDCVQGVN